MNAMVAAQDSHGADETAQAGTQSKELLRRLVSLSPNTDRNTLVQTVDEAVQAVLSRLQHHPAGTPLPDDLLLLTTTTLKFLEACMGMQDPAFTEKARTWATELQAALNNAMTAPAEPQPKSETEPDTPSQPAANKKEAKKAKPKPKAKQAPVEEKAEKPKDSFELFKDAFSEHLSRYIRQKAESFEIMGRQDRKLPFPVAPAFSLIYEQVTQKFIVPRMLQNRRIKNIAESISAEELRGDVFFKMFDKPERENPVLIIWNEVWNEVRQAQASNDDKSKKKQQARAAKQSWLTKIASWKSKDETDKAAERGADTARQIWEAFVAGGVDGNFDPPKPRDVSLLQILFLYEREPIEKAKASLKDFIQAESMARATEGTTRDFLNKCIRDMPDYCGELLALWGYFQHQDHFTDKMLRSFQASNGKNIAERKKYLPLFMRWVTDFTRIKSS